MKERLADTHDALSEIALENELYATVHFPKVLTKGSAPLMPVMLIPLGQIS